MSQRAIIIWHTQLTIDNHSALLAYPQDPIFLIEARNLTSAFKYHKQKLAFTLTAMRDYADELRASGRTVHYIRMEEAVADWFESLSSLCADHNITDLAAMRENDRSPQAQLEAWCKRNGVLLQITPNMMFLTTTVAFDDWAREHKQLRMEQFYRWQRQRLGILMQPDGQPEGGKWNYDSENRKPLPKNIVLPAIVFPKPSLHRSAVLELIERQFKDHPGETDINWLPTSRMQARVWLEQFLESRIWQFGDYEDAMMKGETFLYHSAVSALLNVGLLSPQEVVDGVLLSKAPLASREGFIRQIIGWREFVFGMYHFKGAEWKNENYLDHEKSLPAWWWNLSGSPEPPLEDVLYRLNQYGYSHHIERLMVLGNYMLLSQYKPQEVYDWFMSMYVDAYEWVMVPNIYGMSQYADGGLERGGFATKPYISGSNYLQKMGKWWPSAAVAKESQWTKLYWEFLVRNEQKLANNFRLQPLFKAAKRFVDK
jgi:deoxyribodipyrimidine photolyase-related protein